MTGIAIEYFVRPGPINGSQAHGAGFTGGVDLTAFQLKAVEVLAGIPDGYYLGMSCGVVGGSDPVIASPHYLISFHHNTAKGPPFITFHSLSGKGNGLHHEFFFPRHKLK
jgi:hypothetical protein